MARGERQTGEVGGAGAGGAGRDGGSGGRSGDGAGRPPGRRLPWLAAALLRVQLPVGERDEVLADIEAEYGARVAGSGRVHARGWVWRQVLGSVPALLGRSWWRGWSGFEPEANRMRSGGPMLEQWIIDMRFGVRRLRKRPLFAVLAVLTLALGVGGTAAVWGIVRGFLIEPLPYAESGELSVFWNQFDWSEREILYLEGSYGAFSDVAAWRPGDVTMETATGLRLVQGIASTANLFDVLGTAPALGAGFRAGDDRPGAEPVAVLSHGLWQELGGDPGMVGRTLQLDGAPRTVVGVMPRGFWFPDPSVRMWVPVQLLEQRQSGNYALIGRQAPGANEAALTAELGRIAAMLRESFTYSAQWDKTANPVLTPVREYLVGSARPALLATLTAMAVILLIACANVAALMLGQVDARRTELGVRAALGAGRGQLTRQLLSEALVVGLLAGVTGAALAAAGFNLILTALPLGAMAETATLDWGVFAAAMTVAVLAAVSIALIPTIAMLRGETRDTLASGRTGGVAGRGGRVESALVVAEVALAIVMASGAALLLRSIGNLQAIDAGVETAGLAVLDITVAGQLDAARRVQTYNEVVTAMESVPGVRSAGVTTVLPLRGGGNNWGVSVEGRPELDGNTTFFRIVTLDYLATLGAEIRRGRGFERADLAAGGPDGENVVIINEAMARRYFGDEDPIGHRLSTGFGWERIIGVVENIAEGNLTDEAAPARYMLLDQVPVTAASSVLALRLQPGANAAAAIDAARRTIAATTPFVAVDRTMTMERVFNDAMGAARQVVTLMTLLAALAVTLGAIGVYGVVSHFVTRRRRDWAIRIALGLRPARVVSHVVGRGGLLIAAGVVLGIVGSGALAQLLASMLFGVGTMDPLALSAAAATLLSVGLVAALVPALRASRVDPAKVLREQ